MAAPCTPRGESWGFVFHRCRFTSDCAPETVYLGRPWREYGRVWIAECELGAHIHREGFNDWDRREAHGLFHFAERDNYGDGADRSRCASYVRELDLEEIPRI